MKTSQSKPRVVKDYDKLDVAIQEQIKLSYPLGFERSLIKFQNREDRTVSALPFETEEKYYLVRMTISEAKAIVEDDEDYNDDGQLRSKVKAKYELKYDDEDEDDLDVLEDDDLDEIDEVSDEEFDFDSIADED